MINKNLILNVAKEFGIRPSKAKILIKKVVSCMSDTLIEDKNLYLDKFINLKLKEKEASGVIKDRYYRISAIKTNEFKRKVKKNGK